MGSPFFPQYPYPQQTLQSHTSLDSQNNISPLSSDDEESERVTSEEESESVPSEEESENSTLIEIPTMPFDREAKGMHQPQQVEKLRLDFLNLNGDKATSDVTIVVEGKKFYAHRLILAARSEYFKKMFYGGFQEETQEIIELKEIGKEAFKTILEYLYGGQLAFKDTDTKVISILEIYRACNQLQLPRETESICLLKLEKSLDFQDCLEELKRAYDLGLGESLFAEAIFRYLVADTHFADPRCSNLLSEFDQLPKEILIRLLRSNHFILTEDPSYNELTILSLAEHWIKASKCDEQTQEEIKQLIRYDLLDECAQTLLSLKPKGPIRRDLFNAHGKYVKKKYEGQPDIRRTPHPLASMASEIPFRYFVDKKKSRNEVEFHLMVWAPGGYRIPEQEIYHLSALSNFRIVFDYNTDGNVNMIISQNPPCSPDNPHSLPLRLSWELISPTVTKPSLKGVIDFELSGPSPEQPISFSFDYSREIWTINIYTVQT